MWMIFMDEWMMSVKILGGTESRWCKLTMVFFQIKNEGIFQEETRMWFGFWLWGDAYKDLMEIRFVGSTPEN